MNDKTNGASLVLRFEGIAAAYSAAANARRAVLGFLTNNPKRAEHLSEAIHDCVRAIGNLIGQDLDETSGEYMFALGAGVKDSDALEETAGRLDALEWIKAEIHDKNLYLWSKDIEDEDNDDPSRDGEGG